MKWAKDVLMGAETVLLQLTSEQRPGFDLTWDYRSGTGTVRVLSVPVSLFCQCTGTVRVLSVPVSAPPSFSHVPSALHSAAN